MVVAQMIDPPCPSLLALPLTKERVNQSIDRSVESDNIQYFDDDGEELEEPRCRARAGGKGKEGGTKATGCDVEEVDDRNETSS